MQKHGVNCRMKNKDGSATAYIIAVGTSNGNMKTHTLIRYTGGSGGERISSIAAYYADTQSPLASTSHNRFIFADLFDSMFQLEGPSNTLIRECNLPEIAWVEMDSEMINRVVKWFSRQHPDRTVGKAHHIFSRDLDYATAFPGFKILDLRPAPGKFWITTALHLYKAACNIQTTNLIFNGVQNKEYVYKIKDHFNAHGWWPEYWLWYGPISWDEFLDIACSQLFNKTRPERFDDVADMVLDSANVVTDVDLSWSDEFCKFIGISNLTTDHTSALRNWVNGNLQILERVGITTDTHAELSVPDQIQLLKSKFTPVFYDVIHERFKNTSMRNYWGVAKWQGTGL